MLDALVADLAAVKADFCHSRQRSGAGIHLVEQHLWIPARALRRVGNDKT